MNSSRVRSIALALVLAFAAVDSRSATAAASTEALLKPPLVEDPRQAVIRQVVRSTYPELFGASAAPGWAAVTLLMNQKGTLDKGYKDDTRPRPYITGSSKAFDAMGAEADHYGDRVQLDLRGGLSGATRIYVRAYFPKPVSAGNVAPTRKDGSASNRWQPEQEGPAAPNDDPAVNRSIAEKYFPGPLYLCHSEKRVDSRLLGAPGPRGKGSGDRSQVFAQWHGSEALPRVTVSGNPDRRFPGYRTQE